MALIDNLVAFWPLDEASGTRDDAHSNNYVLTDNNTVTSSTGLVYGTAAEFEVLNAEYLSVSDNANLSGGAGKSFTIAAWVKIDTTGTNRGVLGKGEAGNGFEYTLYFNDGPQRFRWRVASATGEANATFVDQGGGSGGGSVPSAGTWYLLVVWHNATADEIGIATSVDGIGTAYTTAYSSDVWNSGGDFEIGAWGPYFRTYFDGLIGPVMFWSGRVLDSSERTALYNSGAGLTYAALAGGSSSVSPSVSASPSPSAEANTFVFYRRRR